MAPSCAPRSTPPTTSTCSAPSSSGTGLRLLEPELGPSTRARGVPLRVITTTYMGATERAALDRLVRDFGAEVKSPVRTRSDAPARQGLAVPRNTGFDTAYVGSSNLSRAALLDGVEWNVRLSSRRTPAPAGEVRRDVRQLLGRPSLRALRPGPRRATGSTTRSRRPEAGGPSTGDAHSSGSRSGRTPTSRRCSTS